MPPQLPITLDGPRAALRAALIAHGPLDAAEAVDRDAIVTLLERVEHPFSRTTYVPGHITGSAFVVHPPTRRVLLHRHRRLDRWLQLGGHDDGEHDPAATALREAQEESGLDDVRLLLPGILDVDVHAIPAGRGEPAHLHHDIRFAVVTGKPWQIRAAPGESRELAWLGLDDAAVRVGEPGASRALARIASLLGA